MSYNNSIKQAHLSSLNAVMDKGIDLMGKNPNDELFNIWEDYAKSVLRNIVEYRKNYEIMNDYLRFIISIYNLSPFDKFKFTIKKLMDYYRYLGGINY